MFQENRFCLRESTAPSSGLTVCICVKRDDLTPDTREFFIYQYVKRLIRTLRTSTSRLITTVMVSKHTMLLWGSRDLADYRWIPCNFSEKISSITKIAKSSTRKQQDKHLHAIRTRLTKNIYMYDPDMLL